MDCQKQILTLLFVHPSFILLWFYFTVPSLGQAFGHRRKVTRDSDRGGQTGESEHHALAGTFSQTKNKRLCNKCKQPVRGYLKILIHRRGKWTLIAQHFHVMALKIRLMGVLVLWAFRLAIFEWCIYDDLGCYITVTVQYSKRNPCGPPHGNCV